VPDENWGTEGHVIVCGLHGVGPRTVEQLHQSWVPVVAVDDAPDPRPAQFVETWGVTLIRRSTRIGGGGGGLAGADLDRAKAVICVASDEVATQEIAIRVWEARPDVRLVVLVANPSAGRALERTLGTRIFLDPAALAAPSFVEVTLRRLSHQIELVGEQYAVAEVAVDDDEAAGWTFRSRFGHLASLAVVPADGSGIVCCPASRPPASQAPPSRCRCGRDGVCRPSASPTPQGHCRGVGRPGLAGGVLRHDPAGGHVGFDRIRLVHQLPGEPPNREVVRSGQGARHGRPRVGGGAWIGEDPSGGGPGGRRPKGSGRRERHRKPLPRPGPGPRHLGDHRLGHSASGPRLGPPGRGCWRRYSH
jgi:hypothetical protein